MIGDLRVGDFVRLEPRELPHEDTLEQWWEVIAFTDTGISVRAWSGGRVVGRRDDVCRDRVLAQRRRGEHE